MNTGVSFLKGACPSGLCAAGAGHMLSTVEPQGLLASIRHLETCLWGKAASTREQLGKAEEEVCLLSAGSWEGFLEEAT